MAKKSKALTVDHDPALADFLSENKVALETLRILDQLGSQKPEGWIKVPDILRELKQAEEYDKLKNLRSTIHYCCRRLCEKYGAIDRYKGQGKSDRPVYYRIVDKGKAHLSRTPIRRKDERERAKVKE
jgi:hypothetical protein